MTHLPSRVLAALLLLVELLLLVSTLVDGTWGGEQAPFPFVWRDVALVHLLCALPLAWWLTGLLQRRAPAAVLVGIAFLLLGVGLVPFLGPPFLAAVRSTPLLGTGLRAATVLSLALSAALLLTVLTGWSWMSPQEGGPSLLALAAVGTVALVLPPVVYVSARCQHDVTHLRELMEQARLREAHTLAQGLLTLDANSKWNGHPLARVVNELDRALFQLEARVRAPLPAGASTAQRVDRARLLAMLGRTGSAIELLEPARPSPEVENLYATVRETRGEWEPALAAYRHARERWQAHPPSAAQAAELLRASTGIAFCQRKLGRYAEAEAAYQEVLRLSPTADSHFLLAQFYEDTQQAEKARAHARQAMALSPARYQEQGEKLIRKLTVFHFGCLPVFSAEHASSHDGPGVVPPG